MIITNKHNLPEPLVRAVAKDSYSLVGHISATGLIQSPRQRLLALRHDDQIEVDAASRIWALMGTIGHRVLENNEGTNELAEECLIADVRDWRVSGHADLLDDGHLLSDYKFTSVYAVTGELKSDWEAQLNIYAHLYRAHGFDIRRLQIVAILRDWRIGESKKGGDYPPVQVKVLPVPLWSQEKAHRYISDRVRLHQTHEFTPDNELPHCTPEERWERPTTWALIKKGIKRAYRVLDSEWEAWNIMSILSNSGTYEVQKRPGASVRCEDYCDAAPFCNQWATMREDEGCPTS